MSRKYSIALVHQANYTSGGGLSSVAWFLCQVLAAAPQYEVRLFSVETGYNHPANVRLISPRSWFRGIQVSEYDWHDLPVTHVGANFSELEFQRYMPRRLLTDLLQQCDLVQIIAGSPAVAYLARDVDRPLCVFGASNVDLERKSHLAQASPLRKLNSLLMTPVVRQLEHKALKLANHVFALTAYTQQAYLPYISESNTTVDVVGVDTTLFQPVSEAGRRDDYILSVGRLADPRKNIPLLFEAYALLRRAMPDAPRLRLAGSSGPTEANWAVAEGLGVRDFIDFEAAVPLRDLPALYQNAALLVLSSNEEGLGIVLLEAMACATPVVSTRCGGPDTVVEEDTGFLVSVGDAIAMAEHMRWLLEHPTQRREMGQAGWRMVQRRFANDVVGQKYVQVYDRLLGVAAG